MKLYKLKIEDFKKMLTKIEKVFANLCSLKKCIWCDSKFNDGIMIKHTEKEFPVSSHTWFTPEFLVHAQTTHGYSPEAIDYFILSSISGEESPATRYLKMLEKEII